MAEEDPKAPLTGLNYKDDPEFLPWIKEQLKNDPSWADLFAEPADPKEPSAPSTPSSTSGISTGTNVPANQAQDKMGEVVTAALRGLAQGAVEAANKQQSGAPPVVTQVAKKLHPIWGYEVD